MVNSTNIMLHTPVSTSTNLSSILITCTTRNQNDIYTLSKYCVNGSDWSNFECIHHIDEQSFSRNALGIWAIIVSIAGIIGNTLTLLAVPFASNRKRFALDKDWNKRTIFILNLAVCDLMYCIFCLPSYATLYLGGTWFLGENWCFISVVLAFIFASATWMALALIALSGALLVAYPSISEIVFSRTKSRLIILSSWLIVLLMYCPVYAEESVEFGYNCIRGKCDMIKTGKESLLGVFGEEIPHMFLLFVPTMIMICSYIRVCIEARRSTDRVKLQCSMMEVGNLKARNAKITRTVSIICACFMICTFPHNIYGYMVDNYDHCEVLLYNVTLGLQWAQYCLNILMHVIQKDQIWNACLFYIEIKLPIVLNKNNTLNKGERKKSEKAKMKITFNNEK